MLAREAANRQMSVNKNINYAKTGKRPDWMFTPVSVSKLKYFAGNLKPLVLAVQIKNTFINSTVYNYKPQKLEQFDLSRQTIKKYIQILIDEHLAVIHNGNLTIKRLGNSWKNRIRVAGNNKSIHDQLQKALIENKLNSQIYQIGLKDHTNSCITNPKCHKDLVNRRWAMRSGGEILDIDNKLRMTVKMIAATLNVSFKQAQHFKKVLKRKFKFKFRHELKCLGKFKGELPSSNTFFFKGNLFQCDSWIEYSKG